MAPARKTKPKEFNENVLSSMTEPITVNVSMIVGGKLSPIELPLIPGESVSGRGYSKDQVRELGGFLSKEWTGGGTYECMATGANGEEMGWQWYFHPESFPVLTPPSSRTPRAPQQAPAVAHPGFAGPMAPQPAPQQPSGLSLGQLAQSYRPYPQAAAPGQPAAGTVPAYNPYGWGGAVPHPAPQPPTVAAGLNPEREARIKLEGRIERERQEAAHQKQMDAMTQELRRVQEQIGKQPAVEESQALRTAMSEIEKLKQENSTQTLMGQMQAMQTQTNQLIQQMQANTDKQIEAIRREASESNKGDPAGTMMMQMMQAQSQAQQQSTQMLVTMMQANQSAQAEAAKLAQSTQISPIQMIELFRSANQGADQMAAAYGKAWELMAGGVESILNAQGGGPHPALEMAGQALQGVGMMAQEYLDTKKTETQASVQRAHIEAQSRVQQEALRRKDVIDIGPAPGEEPGGVSENDPMPQAARAAEAVEEQDAEVEPQETQPNIEEMTPEEREEFLFGEALPDIKRLRMGVKGGMLDPDKASDAIFQGIEHFAKEGMDLPPVFGLFQQQQFANFVDVLLPDSAVGFREETTQQIIAKMQLFQQQQNARQQAPAPV